MFATHADPFARLHEALDECTALPLAEWPEPRVSEAVTAWCAASSRLAGIGTRLLARWDHAGGWAIDGAANATQWLRARGELDGASRHVRVARNLDRYAPITAAALDADEVSYAKAAVIASAVTAETAEFFARTEQVLVDTAGKVTLAQLERVVGRWRAIAEHDQGDDGDRDETRRARRYLRLTETFDGMIQIEGLLDPAVGAALRELIATLERDLYRQDVADARLEREAERAAAAADVGHRGDSADVCDHDASASGPGDRGEPTDESDHDESARVDDDDDAEEQGHHHDEPVCDAELGRTAGQRRADALADLLLHYLATCHHTSGPTVRLHVTATWEQLHAAATPRRSTDPRLPDPTTFDSCETPAHTDHGHPFPDAELAMAACDCVITRLVVDADGMPLDVGRGHRLVTPAQRRALIQRDGGCAFPGCDRTPEWCDAHHIIPWEHHGPTDMDNLVLLCRKHHTEMHRTDPFSCAIRESDGRAQFWRPDGTPLLEPGAHPRWSPPPPPGRPPDQPPAWVTAA
jgi:hypothetical protein